MTTEKKSPGALTLYYFPASFYSQKVLMALLEKQLPFKRVIVNLATGEVYSPWFMKINPDGQIPVLQDGDKYMSESALIVDYLDKTYGGPQLQPDLSTTLGQKVRHFVDRIDSINVRVLTYGAAAHPDVPHEDKLPWLAKKMMRKAVYEGRMVKNMERMKPKDPAMAELYDKKIASNKAFTDAAKNRDEVISVRGQVRDILHEVEKELRKTKEENPGKEVWLCGEDFTVADICLSILLQRLEFTGYSGGMFKNGLMPNVEEYFGRVNQRQSFKEVCVDAITCKSLVWSLYGHYLPYVGIGSIVLVGAGVGAYLYLKKK